MPIRILTSNNRIIIKENFAKLYKKTGKMVRGAFPKLKDISR